MWFNKTHSKKKKEKKVSVVLLNKFNFISILPFESFHQMSAEKTCLTYYEKKSYYA